MQDPPQPFSKAAEKLISAFRRMPSSEPAKMRRRPTKELSSVLEELRIKYEIGRSSPAQAIKSQWPELVGAANAAYSHPLKLNMGGRLVIQVSHGVVRNELFLHREAIIGRIQQLPGCAKVTALHLIAG